MATLDLATFVDPGLYLVWPDGGRLDLTRDRIEALTRAMLDDPERIPPHVREATEYGACEICPHRDTAEICHAIMPTLPFLDEIDRYMSFDRVTAVFRDEEGRTLHVRETSMQEALKYVSMLSLLYYCEVGRKFSPFFAGVDPLMPAERIAGAVYRNLYVATRGDMREIEEVVGRMQEELLYTTRCQMARLRLISKGDAFLNAFATTQTTTQFLLMELQSRVEESRAPLEE